MQQIFLFPSSWVWENNGLLTNNYREDLDIIYYGHSNGNVSQFCLSLIYRLSLDRFKLCFDHNDVILAGDKNCLIVWP